ncbi:pistil-specific extensin-like protein [Neltuma alba]|uniref:pistil-specific extensin-like protein n=1 Tax=Neltuma alba TaxID=207710 RepID=UPI0010A2D025|nr:pistil-specific extensin-like protein [Prosopis alba]
MMQNSEDHASSTDQQPWPEPPSILRLKDEYVAPEHEELVRLTLATGSNYQSPPQKPPPPPPPPEFPPHPSLLQLMPPSSSFAGSSEPPPQSQPRLSFLQLLSQFSSQSPEPQRFIALPSSQFNNISNLQPPFLPVPAPPISQLHPSLLLPSSFSQPPADETSEGQAHRRPSARRPRNYKKPGWEPTIKPPYPWASNIRAKVLSMEELISKNMIVISGEVYCNECKKQFQMEYDLRSKFSEVVSFIAGNVGGMHNRAPDVWLKPGGLDCKLCDRKKCVQPVIPCKKRNTNWLFLFLGQMIGCCNLYHLWYFCKHNDKHRTATKDRLVYSAYATLHSQLDPSKASDLYNN